MDEDTRQRLEYEEQLYKMSSQFFIDSFKNFLRNEIANKVNLMVDNFKNKLINQAENVERFESGVEKMRETLMTKYTDSITDVFKKGESEISNLLRIPPNVLLKEDLPIQTVINEDINKVREEISELKEKYKALVYMKHELLQELEDADLAIIIMEKYVNDEKVNIHVVPAAEMCEESKQNLEPFKKCLNIG